MDGYQTEEYKRRQAEKAAEEDHLTTPNSFRKRIMNGAVSMAIGAGAAGITGLCVPDSAAENDRNIKTPAAAALVAGGGAYAWLQGQAYDRAVGVLKKRKKRREEGEDGLERS